MIRRNICTDINTVIRITKRLIQPPNAPNPLRLHDDHPNTPIAHDSENMPVHANAYGIRMSSPSRALTRLSAIHGAIDHGFTTESAGPDVTWTAEARSMSPSST